MLAFFRLANTLAMPFASSRSAGPVGWLGAGDTPGGGLDFFRNSAKSEVARDVSETASRGPNFLIATRPPGGAGGPPPVMAAALEKSPPFGGAAGSIPAGMFTWMGMWPPLPPLALLLRLRDSAGSCDAPPLPGLADPALLECPPSRLVSLATRLGALAFFFGLFRVWVALRGRVDGSGGGW